MSKPPRSRIGGILRTVAWALFLAFAFGFLIGTWIRNRLDEPLRYIGERERPPLLIAGSPGDVDHALPCILVTCQYEEKV